MTQRFSLRLAAAGFAVALMVGCGSDTAEQSAQSSLPMADPATIEAATASAPWLRERLPADSIGYIRIPSPWGMLGAPSGRRSDAIHANPASAQAISQIRQATAADPWLSELSAGAAPLLESLASPIEVAVVAAGKMASPAAHVLISVKLNQTDPAQVAALFSGLGDAQLSPEFDDAGRASVDLGGSSAFLAFDADQQRLTVLVGMFANANALTTLLAEIADAEDVHPMRGAEQAIDAVGQGLLVWVDMAALRPILLGSLEPDQQWMKPVLEQLNEVAIGWGSADGLGQLGLRMGFTQAPWSTYLPAGPHRYDLRGAGEPSVVVTAVLPNAEQLLGMVSAAVALDGGEEAPSAEQLDELIEQHLGMSLAQLMAPFAGQIAYVSDDAGLWTAMRITNEADLKVWSDALTASGLATARSRDHAGTTIHHLRVVGNQFQTETDSDGEPQPAWMAELSKRMPSHAYWYVEDGWLYTATVPQPLMERIDRDADFDLQQWIAQSQADAPSGALLSASTMASGAAKTTYMVQLEVLQWLSEVSGAEVDLFDLPTAQQLGLPSETPVGIALTTQPDLLSLQMHYEQTPFEGAGAGGGMAGIAAAGVLLAIAIPAYQDYLMRAKVAEALLAAKPLQLAISEHYVSTGELPGSADAVGMQLPQHFEAAKVTVDIDGGAVFIRFDADADAAIANRYLYMLPAGEAGSISWVCAYAALHSTEPLLLGMQEGVAVADIEAKYLPASCR